MGSNENKIHVAIAAKQFFYRLGIKNMLSVIGVDPELFEAINYNDIESKLRDEIKLDFIIISDDIIDSPKDFYLSEINSLCPCSKLMVIGDEIINNCPCSHFVLNSDSQREVLKKFQSFFFEPAKTKSPQENDNLVLSEREIDILKLVALGYTNKEIAEELYISVNTVITHRKNLTEKLGIKTISGITVYAIMNNLINPDDVKF